MDRPLAAPALSPIALSQRISGVDFARGIALLGILLVNARFFFWPFAAAIDPACEVPGLTTTTLDAVVWSLIEAFCSFKFISLFSLLFGFGIAMQASRAGQIGRSRWGFGSRRLMVLFGIGLLHATLVWYGDILVVYAVFGFLVLALSACKPKTLLICFFVLAGIMIFFALCSAVLSYLFSVYPQAFGESVAAVQAEATEQIAASAQSATPSGGSGARGLAAIMEVFEHAQFSFADPLWMQAETVAHREGPWLDMFAFRIAHWLVCISAAIFGYGWHACALMLFGAYAFRSGLLEAAARMRRVRIGWRCVCIGTCFALLSVLPYWMWGLRDPRASALHMLGLTVSGLTLPLGYAVFLVEYAHRVPDAIRLPITAAGRMALTVYLCESILATALASWWGFALFARLSDASLALVSLAIWVALVSLAWWWLRYRSIGPAEWLWRRLSYGRGAASRDD